jgi:hypothetical protein
MPDTFGTPSTGLPQMGYLSMNPVPPTKDPEGMTDMPPNTGARRENVIEIPTPPSFQR